jgi:hypothetical protein
VAYLVTGAFIALFVYTAYRVLYLQLRGQRTMGTITELVPDDSGDGRVYHPVVTFTTRTGVVVVAKSPYGMAGAGTYFRVGERVPILYAAQKPHFFAIAGYDVAGVFYAFLAAAGAGAVFYWGFLKQ